MIYNGTTIMVMKHLSKFQTQLRLLHATGGGHRQQSLPYILGCQGHVVLYVPPRRRRDRKLIG